MTTTDETTRQKWAGKHSAAQMLGISTGAISVLMKDKVLPPDCLTCGKIVWRIEELAERRNEVREYLRSTYPDMVQKLIVSE